MQALLDRCPTGSPDELAGSGIQRQGTSAARDAGDTPAMADTIVVVPCYNEADRLPVESFKRYAATARGIRFLFVDDGSRDRTLEVLRGLEAERPDAFRVLALPHNAGKAEAVRRGVLAGLEAGARYVGFWDADLSTPLEAIGDLRAVMEAKPGIEAVFGSRVQLLGRAIERHAWRHYLGRVFATAASLTLRLRVYDTQCGAKLFRASDRLAELFRDPFCARWIFDVELIARMIRQRRGTALPGAESVIYEFPLLEWRDVPGSKLKARDFARAALDLARIYRVYLRAGAPPLSAASPAQPRLLPHGVSPADNWVG